LPTFSKSEIEALLASNDEFVVLSNPRGEYHIPRIYGNGIPDTEYWTNAHGVEQLVDRWTYTLQRSGELIPAFYLGRTRYFDVAVVREIAARYASRGRPKPGRRDVLAKPPRVSRGRQLEQRDQRIQGATGGLPSPLASKRLPQPVKGIGMKDKDRG
jgi:hypothetical protein